MAWTFVAALPALIACSSSAQPEGKGSKATANADAGVTTDPGPTVLPTPAADGGPAPTATGPIDVACAADSKAYCAALAQKAPDYLGQHFLDAANCEATNLESCKLVLTSPDTGWTPEARNACAAAWSTATADQLVSLTNLPVPCRAPAGKRPDGAACALAQDCAGRACFVSGGAMCGICAARVKAGGACNSWNDCEDGLQCLGDGGSGATCQPPLSIVPIGTACSESIECGSTRYCKGLYVWSDASQSWFVEGGTCQAMTGVAPGGPCGDFDGPGTTEFQRLDSKTCTKGSSCDYASGTTGTCQPLPTAGQPCETSCAGFALCIAKKCVPITSSACK